MLTTWTFAATEMFKVEKIVHALFFMKHLKKKKQNSYNLRNTTEFNIPLVKTVYNELESLSCLGPKIWNTLPIKYKEIKPLLGFKTKIIGWSSYSYPCWLCKNHTCNFGYVHVLVLLL